MGKKSFISRNEKEKNWQIIGLIMADSLKRAFKVKIFGVWDFVYDLLRPTKVANSNEFVFEWRHGKEEVFCAVICNNIQAVVPNKDTG